MIRTICFFFLFFFFFLVGERGELFFVFMSNCESIAFINFRYVLLMKLVHKMFFFSFVYVIVIVGYISQKKKKKRKRRRRKRVRNTNLFVSAMQLSYEFKCTNII